MSPNLLTVWPIVALMFARTTLGATAAEPAMRTVEVSAGSEIFVMPDEVLLTLLVNTEKKEILEAKSENDRRTRAILQLAPKHQIPEKHVQIDYLRIRPRYERPKKGAPLELRGYHVVRSIQFTLHDFAALEPLLSDALGAGATEVDNILFRTTKHREYQFEARRLAVVHAKEKASHLAELNGLKLGKALMIEHGLQGDEHTIGFASTISTFSGQESGRLKVHLVSTGAPTPATVKPQKDTLAEREPIAPGVLSIKSTVTITFEMHE